MRSHLSWKATFLMQNGWSHKRGSNVILVVLYLYVHVWLTFYSDKTSLGSKNSLLNIHRDQQVRYKTSITYCNFYIVIIHIEIIALWLLSSLSISIFWNIVLCCAIVRTFANRGHANLWKPLCIVLTNFSSKWNTIIITQQFKLFIIFPFSVLDIFVHICHII